MTVLGAAACAQQGNGGDVAGNDPVETKTAALQSDAWGHGRWDFQLFADYIAADPTVCSNRPGYALIFDLAFSDRQYYGAYKTAAEDPYDWSAWTGFGGTPSFWSPPSCTFEKPFRIKNQPTTSDNKFILAGKSWDGKIYALLGHQQFDPNPGDLAPPPPHADTGWTAVSSTTYLDGSGNPTNYGRPAVFSNGSLVGLTFMTGDGKVHAFTRGVPYASSMWSGDKVGPALPTGVVADGIPAITYVRGWSGGGGVINKFAIFVRGVSGGVAKYYWIYFDGNTFGSWSAGITPPSSSGYSVDSDLAVEYDDQSDAVTVYFKSLAASSANGGSNDGRFVQATVVKPENLSTSTSFDPIDIGSDFSPIKVNAPKVVFGSSGELYGIRRLVTRGQDPYTAPGDEFKTLLLTEDSHYAPFPPYDTAQLPYNSNGICADHGEGDVFRNGVVGCPGAVTFANRASLCAPGSRPCTAAEYNQAQAVQSITPTHMYWTNDSLRYSGSSGACSVSTTSGTVCPSGRTMHVCNASGTDPEGNTCNFHNCGYGSNSPNRYYGGCTGDLAGTLCCLAVP